MWKAALEFPDSSAESIDCVFMSSSQSDCFCLISLGRLLSVLPALAVVVGEWRPLRCSCCVSGALRSNAAVALALVSIGTSGPPRLGTLERDRTIWRGGGCRMLPRLRDLWPAESGGSAGKSSKSSSRRSSIGKSLASS